MIPLRNATLHVAHDSSALFALERGWRCEVRMLESGLGRMLWHPPDGLREPRTWAIATGVDEVPWEGRGRENLAGFAAGRCEVDDRGDLVVLTAERLRAVVRLAPFGITWQQSVGDQWTTCCADRATYAYAVGQHTTRIVHSVARDAQDQYFGMGDKTGPLDKQGRRLRTLQLDALGYNGETSDPLYKHWPMFLGRRRDSGVAYGIYYDTLSECTFDFGAEYDNYHGFYRSTDIADGDLDCYVFAGPKLRGALARFMQLVGGTALPPRWTLGFANTAMGWPTRPTRRRRSADFLGTAERERIPLSTLPFRLRLHQPRQAPLRLHLEPRQVSRAESADSAHFAKPACTLVANLKPCLLDDHPAYRPRSSRRARSCSDGRRAPCIDAVLGRLGRASRLHASRGDRAWWQTGLQQQVLDDGIDVGWNDNNEYEIWDEGARPTASGSRCRCRVRVRCRRC